MHQKSEGKVVANKYLGFAPDTYQKRYASRTISDTIWAFAIRERRNMAHALLKFDLSEPDDERLHRYALAGRDALIALEVVENRCRAILKHGDPSEETQRIVEEIRALVPYELTSLLV